MEFKGTKGNYEVIEHNWSDTSLMCGDEVIASHSIYEEATEETQEILEDKVSANFKLFAQSLNMLEAMQEFCDRVDKGEVRSTKTYKKFKEIIHLVNS